MAKTSKIVIGVIIFCILLLLFQTYRPDYFLKAKIFPKNDIGTIQCGDGISWNFGTNNQYKGGRMFVIRSGGGGGGGAQFREKLYINLYKDDIKVGEYLGYYWDYYYSGVPLHIMRGLYMMNNALNVFDEDKFNDEYINIVVSSSEGISHNELIIAAKCLEKEKDVIVDISIKRIDPSIRQDSPLRPKKLGWIVVVDQENIVHNIDDASKNPKLEFRCDLKEYSSLLITGQDVDIGSRDGYQRFGYVRIKLDGTFINNVPRKNEDLQKLLVCYTGTGITLKQYLENISNNIFPLQ